MWNLAGGQQRGLPLYKQLVSLIEQAIENGLLQGGERLPAERRLCALLGVNRSTVIRALDDLADRGVLLRRRGSGSYVNPEKWGLQQYPILNWQAPGSLRVPAGAGTQAARLSRYRAEALRSGRPVLDLSGGDLPGDLLPQVVMPERSWQEVLGQELDAESSLAGLAGFRETVRGHLARNLKLDANPSQILITSGAQQALFLITQCLLQPGDAVGIEAPSYFYSLPVFQAAGLRLFAIPTDSEGVRPDGLDALVARRGLKMIFLNPFFQNPTGHAMSAARKMDILHYCSARHIPIVEDDAYSLLAFDPAADVSPIKSLDRHGQVIYVGSLSSYMGKNVRAGWLVAPASIVQRLAAVRGQIDAGLSVLPQLLADHYLRGMGRQHIQSLRVTLARRADALQGMLAGLPAACFSCDAPRGGFYMYLRAAGSAGERKGPDLLDALLAKGIIPAPGSDFGDGEGRFRLHYGHLKP